MKRGFTLVEMLIVISNLATIILVATLVYRTGLRSFPENFEKSNIQSDVNFATDALTNNIKNATAAAQSYGSYDRHNNADESILILNLPAKTEDNPPDFIYSGNVLQTDTVIYYLSEGNLIKRYYGAQIAGNRMIDQAGDPNTLLSNVTDFSCQYLNLVNGVYSTVSCSVTVQKSIFGKNYTVSETKTANLRNIP